MATRRRLRSPLSFLSSGVTRKLAAALVVGSIVVGTFDAYWLLLSPARVLTGAVWQPLTYCFVENSPIAVVLGALILYSIGGFLERAFGSRRVLQMLLGIPVASGIAVTLLALGFPTLRAALFVGGSAMVSVAWCAYGWSLGRSHANVYGVTVTGNQFAAVGILFVILEGAHGSFEHVLPDAIAIAITYDVIRRLRR